MRLGTFAFFRLLIMLRRIWQSIDKLADIEQARLAIEQDRMALDYPKWSMAGRKIPSNPRKTEISVAEVSDWNKRWREQHPDEEG